jgi:predicted phosphodiesterase
MLIKFISDLHLEFCDAQERLNILEIIGCGEVLVLAGDLGDPFEKYYSDLFAYVSSNFEKVFCICGNHEYYNHKMDKTNKKFAQLCNEYGVVNMNQNMIEYNNIRFIGTPMWTHVESTCLLQCDTRRIKDMGVKSRNNLYEKNFKFIQDNLVSELPTVIITHHLPSYSLIQDQYLLPEYVSLNEWFASSTIENLDFTDSNVKAWIYGHTHSPLTKMVQYINTYCNPVGYPDENNELDIQEIMI